MRQTLRLESPLSASVPDTVVRELLPSHLLASVPNTVVHEPSPSGEEEQVGPDVIDQRAKRQKTAQTTFARDINALTGLDPVPAEGKNRLRCSLCKTCGTVTIRNVTARWRSHARSCSGLKSFRALLSAEAQVFVVQCTAGGEKHLNKLCDEYIVAYWLYKHKIPFAMGPKVHEVHFVSQKCSSMLRIHSNSLFLHCYSLGYFNHYTASTRNQPAVCTCLEGLLLGTY